MSKNKHYNGEQSEPKTAVKSEQNVSVEATDVSNEKDSETVVLNLQPYLIPISIIINAIIIAIAILLLGRGGFTTTTSTLGATAVPTAAAADPNGQASTTNIKDSPYLGNRDSAKVAIVEFSDFECPFCQRHFQQVFPDIKKNYIDSGKIIYAFKNYIAVPSHNPIATTEAYAALCVRELSGNSNQKFFDYHDLLYTNTKTNGAGLGDTDVYKLGTQMGVNADALKTCVESAKYAATMTSDEADGNAAGIQGTPGFVVGVLSADGTVTGKLIAGAYPYTEFQAKIDEMLAQAQ